MDPFHILFKLSQAARGGRIEIVARAAVCMLKFGGSFQALQEDKMVAVSSVSMDLFLRSLSLTCWPG